MPHKTQLSDLLVNIGQNLKRIRKSKDITQQELADLCNMEQSNICKIEKLDYSNVTILTLVKLTIALECGFCDLMQKK